MGINSGFKGLRRQKLYVEGNIHVRSRNHCCCGKAVSITYAECVFVSLSYPACNAHAPYCHELNGLIGNKNITNYIKAQRLAWFGHVHRMSDNSMVKKYMSGHPR